MKIATLTLVAVALASSQAWSQIYKTVDEDGNVSFSDKPSTSAESEQVELQHTNSVSPPPAMPNYGSNSGEPASEEEPAAIPVASITSPQAETTIPMGPGNFGVSASTQPPLQEGQALQLLMDDDPQGPPQTSGSWSLTNVFRGAHDLSVAVIAADGEILSTSEPVRVYVMRPSIN